jgi:SAM-dependent methyltransferase
MRKPARSKGARFTLIFVRVFAFDKNVNCPLCRQESERKFEHRGYWIRVCLKCRHHFTELNSTENHIEQIYNDEYFQGAEAGYPDYLREEHLLRSHGSWYAKKISRYVETGKMLDVGAAAGFILQGFVDYGWNGRGVEPNDKMARHARDELKLDVKTSAFEKFESNEQFDLISMIQVVAHFIAPLDSFQKTSSLVKDGGYLLIETWNRESVTAKLWGKNWHEWSPPSVLQWFTPDSLKNVLSQFGFREIKRGRPSKWIEASHAKSLLRYRFENMPLSFLTTKALNIVPDKLSLPYPAEDLFFALYRMEKV